MALSISGVAGSVASTLTGTYSRAVGAVDYGARVAQKSETLLDETIETMRVARPLIQSLSEAVDDGLLDEMRNTVRQTDSTIRLVNTVSRHVEHALYSTVPILSTLPSTQEDVRIAREAAERLVGLVTATLEPLDSLPGAKLVRRRIVRAPGDIPPAVAP
jgi:hypothetical protein